MYGHARFMPPVKAARESTTTSFRWFLRLARPRKMLRTGMNEATSPPAATSGARNHRLTRHDPKLSINTRTATPSAALRVKQSTMTRLPLSLPRM